MGLSVQVASVLGLSVLGLATEARGDEPMPWVEATPDEMIATAKTAAAKKGPDVLARLLVIRSLAADASGRRSRDTLAELGRGGGDVAAAARWMALGLSPEKVTPWSARAQAYEERATAYPGLLRSFAVMGPYENTGDGLERVEGPERGAQRFGGADDSWGVFAVRPVRSLVTSVDARGLPLDLYLHPRRESCAYLASLVTTPERPFVVHVASSGSLRLLIDGKEVLRDEAVHAQAVVDRAAVTLDGPAGDHELMLKVCSGARPDTGRVRVRFSEVDGTDLALATSSSLERLDALRARRPRPLGAKPGATLLAGATAPSDGAHRTLVAAIVHRLGGADDLRSERTGGLLDRLVEQAGKNRADWLAMAGWLTPFVANKSGWLARAWQIAEQKNDGAVTSFAQRALVGARLDIGSIDLARATAERAPLSDAEDAHARWLRTRLDAREGGTGLDSKALLTLEAMAAELGEQTPASVWDSLADAAEGRRPGLALGARQRLAQALPGNQGPAYARAFAMMGAEGFERAALAVTLHQASAGQLALLGNSLLDAGRYEAAVEVFELLTQLSPNRSFAFRGLARGLKLRAPDGSGAEATLAALSRASELEPRDNELSAELRFRKGEQSDEPLVGEDAAYLVAPEVFLARRKARPAPASGVFARQLHWRRVVRLHADKRVSQLMHYAREILVEPRTENERYESVPGGYGTELLVARVHRDGALIPPEEKNSRGMVRWPELKRGDVVEIAVRNWTRGPVGRRGDPPFFFVDYVGSVETSPVLHNEVVIDAPVGSPFAFDVIGGDPDERRSEERDGRRITHLIWTAPPSIPDEPFAPKMSELVPVVVGSIYPGWGAFLSWYEGAVEGFTTPDEQIKRIASEITEGKRTREQKVEALFDFVADDIRYVNFVSGEWWLPNRPQQLLARRQGDCDDKAMLLIGLLRAVGIEAHEVLIQTRHTAQRRVMQSSKAAIPMFDHGIIYLPNENGEGGRYLDATSPKSRMGSLPAMDSGAMALLVGPGHAPKLTPLGTAADHGVTSTWTLAVQPDGSGSLDAVERHVGDDAFRLRTHLGEQDTRAQWVEQNLIAGWFTGLTMSPEVGFSPDLGDGRAEVSFRASSGSLARVEGEDLVVEIRRPMPISSILAPLTTRELPVELPTAVAPSKRTRTVRVLAPKGFRFAPLPPDAEEDGGPFGRAEVVFDKKNEREVQIRRTLALATPRISAADYPRWRAWLQRVDGTFSRGIRLVPIK
jgi:transglutaminase-like putative cysteine protease/tetratricopeptide (TPR) repeat protein